jgi:hypothetical protein
MAIPITLPLSKKKAGLPLSQSKAHTVLYYYMGEVIGQPRLCEQNGDEHPYRNVAMKILTVKESFAAFQTGELNAYPTMKEAFCRFAWILKCSITGLNPFSQVYPANWAEEQGLMERPWKDDFISL